MDYETLAGIAVYAMDNHGGQNSRLYRLMSRIRFNAGRNDRVVHEEIRTGAAHMERGGKLRRVWERQVRAGKAHYRSVPTSEWQRAAEVYATLKARNAQ